MLGLRFLRAGKAARAIAIELDLVRLVGPRVRWREFRERDASAERAVRLDAFYDAVWTDAAAQVGGEIRRLGRGFLEIRKGSKATRVRRQLVQLDDPVTLELAGDKPLVHELLRDAGLPVPDHLAFPAGEIERAFTFLDHATGSACVVKPSTGTDRGTGVTGGVRRRGDLLRACVRAARWDERVLIEREVRGRVYRLLFLDGELLDAVARSRPSVVGDGQSTVADLIAAENRSRLAAGGWEALSLLTIDLDCVLALRAAGLGIRSVVAQGVKVEVKSATSQNRPRENETARDLAVPLVEEASNAARAVGARLAGVDVITVDPTRSLTAAGGVILEVNTTPGLNPHYLVADRAAASPVAVPILRAVLGGS